MTIEEVRRRLAAARKAEVPRKTRMTTAELRAAGVKKLNISGVTFGIGRRAARQLRGHT